MNKISTLAKLSAAALLSTCVSMANAGERISDFSLVDAKGRFFQLSRHANKEAIVVFAQDGSRDVRKAAKDIAELTARSASSMPRSRSVTTRSGSRLTR